MVDQGGERHSEDELRIGYRFITVSVYCLECAHERKEWLREFDVGKEKTCN